MFEKLARRGWYVVDGNLVVGDPAKGKRVRSPILSDARLAALHPKILAIEAGVPRNALTQRHTDLKDEFYQRIRDRGADNEDEARLRATIAKLRQTITSKNRELTQLRADVPALVRAVNQLTLELQETSRAELTALGNVTRLDSRRGPDRRGDEQ